MKRKKKKKKSAYFPTVKKISEKNSPEGKFLAENFFR